MKGATKAEFSSEIELKKYWNEAKNKIKPEKACQLESYAEELEGWVKNSTDLSEAGNDLLKQIENTTENLQLLKQHAADLF